MSEILTKDDFVISNNESKTIVDDKAEAIENLDLVLQDLDNMMNGIADKSTATAIAFHLGTYYPDLRETINKVIKYLEG